MTPLRRIVPLSQVPLERLASLWPQVLHIPAPILRALPVATWLRVLDVDPAMSLVAQSGPTPLGVLLVAQRARRVALSGTWKSARVLASLLDKFWDILQTTPPSTAGVLLPDHPDSGTEVWMKRGFSQWREVLTWERDSHRGVLHDPPVKWIRISPDEYLRLAARWHPRVPTWARENATLKALIEAFRPALIPFPHADGGVKREPLSGRWREKSFTSSSQPDLLAEGRREASERPALVSAYQVTARHEEPAGALLFWRPTPALIHVLDLTWDPKAGPRDVARYLLQTLYLHHPEARVFLHEEPADSPLSRVLMALRYRVYHRFWEWRNHVA